MTYMVDHPALLSVLCLVAMWAAALAGSRIRSVVRREEKGSSEDLTLVVTATLTLLGLIIGFTFSMATARYDQRRLFEEQEANAIGTEYVRLDLLPAPQVEPLKRTLLAYLDHRIVFYRTEYGHRLMQDDRTTQRLQAELWAGIRPEAAARPSPVTALVVSGMNDVLNAEGYTQFAWWNRIPLPAWELMIVIALAANGLVGYSMTSSRLARRLLVVLPVVVAISFGLIGDIDSPRGGMIRVPPVDLINLSQSLHGGEAQ